MGTIVAVVRFCLPKAALRYDQATELASKFVFCFVLMFGGEVIRYGSVTE